MSACLIAVWDGPYRFHCSMGSAGVCHRHGPHRPHPSDGRACTPNSHDGYCHTHGVYMEPTPEEATQ